MSYENIIIQERDEVLILTINRPKALNALNDSVFKNLIKLFKNDINPSQCKGVVITGAGEKAFVAGADITEFSGLSEVGARSLSKRGQDIFAFIEHFRIPVIAAVNGYALGGGCELAMACHLRVAGNHARFGQPEVNLGILPGYGGTQRLVQLIGKGRALELLMTGEMINAETAFQYGLVNKLCEPGQEVDTAIELIHKISTKAPLAIAEVIKATHSYFDDHLNGYDEEVKAFGRLAHSEDFKEGASAFIEKRKPKWKGK